MLFELALLVLIHAAAQWLFLFDRQPGKEWIMRECQGREPPESWSTSSQSNRVPPTFAASWLAVVKPSRSAGGLKGCSRSVVWAIISNVQPAQQCPEDRRLAHRMPRSVAVPVRLPPFSSTLSASFAFLPVCLAAVSV